MEHCATCNLQYKQNKKNHELTNTHLAANNEYYCPKCKIMLNLADIKFNLKSKEHENSKRMWYFEACKKYINNNTKPSHIISTYRERSYF